MGERVGEAWLTGLEPQSTAHPLFGGVALPGNRGREGPFQQLFL